MFKFNYRHIANLMLSVSILGNIYSFVIGAEDDHTNASQASRPLHDIGASFRKSTINFLKDDIFMKFKAQKNHKDHVLRYSNSTRSQKAIEEVHNWMWNEMKERAILFFKNQDYESYKF